MVCFDVFQKKVVDTLYCLPCQFANRLMNGIAGNFICMSYSRNCLWNLPELCVYYNDGTVCGGRRKSVLARVWMWLTLLCTAVAGLWRMTSACLPAPQTSPPCRWRSACLEVSAHTLGTIIAYDGKEKSVNEMLGDILRQTVKWLGKRNQDVASWMQDVPEPNLCKLVNMGYLLIGKGYLG